MTEPEGPHVRLVLRTHRPSTIVNTLLPTSPPSAPPSAQPAPESLPVSGAKIGALAGVLSLAACGGGSDAGAGPEPSPDGPDSGSGSPPLPATRSAEETALFLGQASLGAGRAEVASLSGRRLEDWLDEQFGAPPTSSHVDWLYANGYSAETFRYSQRGLDNTVWRALIGGGDTLRQRVVLALSEICVVSVLGVDSAWRQFGLARYLDILQTNAFGNYRQLLEDLTLSPAMGYFLTYRGNAKANPKTGSQPDENYARELMQLFTIGLVQLNPDGSPVLRGGVPVETYRAEDVSGLARVFTGWDLDATGLAKPYSPESMVRPMAQVASRYETGAKQFLGTTISDGSDARSALRTALDTLFQHPNVPPFVSRQLIQRFVTSNPSSAYVRRVAAIFANNGKGVRGDLRAVVRAILLDPAARDPARLQDPTWGKLREPVQRFVHWARAFGASSTAGAWDIGDLSDPGSRLGQSPLRSPSVFNFFRPGYVPPNTALASHGLVAPEFQITNESTVAGYVNFMQRAVAGKNVGDLRADYAGLLALAPDAAALLAELQRVLAGGQLAPATLATVVAAVNSMPAKTSVDLQNRVYAALTLVLAAPEYLVQK